MNLKTIVGIIAGLLALGIVILGGYTMGIVMLLLSAIGLFEFYHAFELKGHKPVKWVGYIYLLMIITVIVARTSEPLTITLSKLGNINLFAFLQYLIMAILLSIIVFEYDKHNIIDIAITVMGGYYVVFLPTFFLYLRYMEGGVYLFLISLIGTVSSDTMAQVFGSLWGKKKLIPDISPKKTVVGSIGAFVGPLIFVVLYGFIMNKFSLLSINLIHFVVLALLLGLGAQIGDLAASAIKRYTGIKDFGKVIPGHGGVLDRIDSLLFSVPLVYYYLRFIQL